eukprot:TRINITY_DN7627_c0_g1_i2.p1 TRINITY_DN7627_c0_g1~~TRINITY_DN7627_c0_g1_i2.p1  ORF type:complete len:319 (-),score=57.06 TRINITY_DN7627_c0_g1_i2:87-1013(-)
MASAQPWPWVGAVVILSFMYWAILSRLESWLSFQGLAAVAVTMALTIYPRRRLFDGGEIMDQDWCPKGLMGLLQDTLRCVWNLPVPGSLAGPAEHVAPFVAKALDATAAPRIVDMCSGGGGPAVVVRRLAEQRLGRPVGLQLTDLFPNIATWRHLAAAEASVTFRTEPVDATAVPPSVEGLRTIFASFHHLPPVLARGVLQDAVSAGRGILIVDILPDVPMVLLTGPMACVANLVMVATKWELRRLLWTPLILPIHLFDGTVSALRSYSPAQLWDMINSLEGTERFRWSVEPIPAIGMLCLTGVPRSP